MASSSLMMGSVRLMRMLASLGIFTETDQDTYVHNRHSLILSKPKIRAIVQGMSVSLSSSLLCRADTE
jgi:hypothetical protein